VINTGSVTRNRYVTGIVFNNTTGSNNGSNSGKNWNICRISVDINHDNFIL
jgi:hypothetical protein